MPKISRRLFLLSAASLPGCFDRLNGDAPVAPSAAVRGPSVGQSWTYAKHDLFTGKILDTQIDQVVTVDRTVEIDSRTKSDKEDGDAQAASQSTSWLRKYFRHPKLGGKLPSEIQDPWGMVLVDPHWGQVQVFDAPIPLWPARLTPGWHTHFNSRYKTSDRPGAGLPWEQTMKAEAWEMVKVPAGEFKALRYINVITFQSSDPGRTGSVRRESIWFAPEVGRWVIRESKGSYYMDESVDSDEHMEDSSRWELLAWS